VCCRRHRAPQVCFVLVAVSAILFLSVPIAYAVPIAIVNLDDAGEGFNDPTPVTPVGSNVGTTLGEQRLIAVEFAAAIWGSLLDGFGSVEIAASFDPLACNATSAALGMAGPSNASRDFDGALAAQVWFVSALANKLAGTDLDPGGEDASATFNSSLGTTCVFPRTWYYGLDAAPTADEIDLVSVVLHELAHGLGFLSLVDLSTGEKFFGFDDAYSLWLEDHSTALRYPNMPLDSDRIAASTDTGDLHWVGPSVTAASGGLTSGAHPSGHVEMYAPSPSAPGSSVSHFSNALEPNELMEPFFITANHSVGLAVDLLLDIGWGNLLSCGDGVLNSWEECDDGNNLPGDCCSGFCQLESSLSPCEDGNLCTSGDTCDALGLCVPGGPANCDDGSACTDDTCDPGIGCLHQPRPFRCAGDIQFNAYTANDQNDIEVAADAAGTFVAVWTSRGQDGSYTGVFGRRMNDSGMLIDTDFQVNTTTLGRQNLPAVCIQPTGEFIVVWTNNQEGSNSGADVVARRFDGSAAPLGAEFQVNTYTTGNQGIHDGAQIDCSNSAFIITWTDDSGYDGSHAGVFARRFTSAGQPLGTEFQVNTYTTESQGRGRPTVKVDPNGGFVIVWPSGCGQGYSQGGACPQGGPGQDGSYGGVFGQRYDSSGALIGTEFQVNTTTDGSQGNIGLDIDIAAAGKFVVAWQGAGDGSSCGYLPCGGIFAQSFDAAGLRVGSEFIVNSHRQDRQTSPRVETLPDGGFLVVWAGGGGQDGGRVPGFSIPELGIGTRGKKGGSGIFGQRYDSVGTPLGSEFLINSYVDGNQDSPSLAVSPTGSFLIAWTAGITTRTARDCNPSPDGCNSGVFAKTLSLTAAACTPEPRQECAPATKSKVKLLNSRPDKRALSWAWDGSAVLGDFTPAGGMNGYALCMYDSTDGVPSLVFNATVPPYPVCGNTSCWTIKRHRRIRYKDKMVSHDGVQQIQVRKKPSGIVKTTIKGKGLNLALPDLASLRVPITVQLSVNNGTCWQADFASANKRSGRFSARLD